MSQESGTALSKWKKKMQEDAKVFDLISDKKQEERYWKERLASDNVTQNFEKAYLEAEPVIQYLQNEVSRSDDILEVGPGIGAYTFSLAQNVKTMTCVDISTSVLAYIEKQVHCKRNFNIKTICKNIEQMEFEEKYDVVIALNCFYLVERLDVALFNLNQAAKRRVIVGMNTNADPPHVKVAHEKYGFEMKKIKRDYNLLLNVLSEMGIDAECRFISTIRTHYYSSFEKLVEDNTKQFKDEQKDQHILKDIIKDYVSEKAGMWKYQFPYQVALISWQPTQLKITEE